MCAPAVVALIGAGLSMKQQKDAADYQSGVDLNNARLAGYRRSDALQRGASEARRTEIAGGFVADRAAVEIEGGGIDSTTGSAAKAVAASRIYAGIDADRLRANAAREAWGFEHEQKDLEATARFRKKSGYMGALGTGLSGIGSASSYWAASRNNDKGA